MHKQSKWSLHKATTALLITALSSFASISSTANADVVGDRVEFRSPSGLTESCVVLARVPGGRYSAKDLKAENEFCALDLYSNSVAMCPKTWSTSPGTMLYATEGLSPDRYEATRCAGKDGHEKLAKFKNTMNAQGTSSTFSTSSLLYYHFSRYFETTIDVPPAVYRTIDKDQHYVRVAKNAKGAGRMNPVAWSVLRAAELNPSSYGSAIDELFTPDRKQIYGILLKDKGVGYGPEIDGTEAGGWGSGASKDFQETPAYLALRSESDLRSAIQEGLSKGTRDPILKKAIGPGVSFEQMVY